MGTSSPMEQHSMLLLDHPHAYGDKKSISHGLSLLLGSSPRVWGQARILICCVSEHRIIPTRMGTRTSKSMSAGNMSNHPHAYGDKKSPAVLTAPSTGSSPRVWGQGYHSTAVGVSERIIPTRMGTRVLITRPQHTFKDHPHAYGDKRCRWG